MVLELISKNPLAKWLEVTTNVNVYNSKINTDNVTRLQTLVISWSFFGKMNCQFKLPKEFQHPVEW